MFMRYQKQESTALGMTTVHEADVTVRPTFHPKPSLPKGNQPTVVLLLPTYK